MLKKGFSLIEVLVAMLVFIITIAGGYYIFTHYINMLKERYLISCVVESAYSAMNLCMKGIQPPTEVTCGNYEISISGSCNLPQGECGNVSVTANAEGFSLTLNGTGCNLGL